MSRTSQSRRAGLALVPPPIALLSLLLPLVWLAGCGEDAAGPSPADVNEYLLELPAWTDFAPLDPDQEGATGPSTSELLDVSGSSYRCTSTPYSITRTPEEIVTLNPDSEILWPGALLQGQGYLQGIGSLQELPIRQRAPLTLSIDLLTDGTTQTVESPELASVTQAVGSLIQAAHDRGHVSGSNIYYTNERVYSYDQVALKLGVSAKYTGVEAGANLSASLSSEKTSITAYFIQRMFTVSAVLPQTPGEFFSDDFSQELLQEQVDRGRIGPDNLPVFVSNIVYGRILMFTFTSSSQSDSVAATVNVLVESSGTSAGANLSASQQAIVQNAQISVVTVGGDAANALALIRSGDLSQFFASDSPLTAARPISYTVRNLGDNSVARFSETTQYSLTECVPEAQTATGATYRVKATSVKMSWPALPYFPCDPPINLFTAATCEMFYDFWAQDALNAPTRSVQWVSSGIHTHAETMTRNETFTLENSPGRASTTASEWVEFQVHFDGRDTMKFYGEVWDWDPVTSDRLAIWDLNYSGSNVPIGNHASSRSFGVSGKATATLYFTIQKVGDLFD
jgi:hypothetical protein